MIGNRSLWRVLVPLAALLMIIVVVVPSSFEAYRLRQAREELGALHDQVSQSHVQRSRLENVETQLNDDLAEMESRSMVVGDQDRVRARLLEMVRNRNGQLRQLEIGHPEKRHWLGMSDQPDKDLFSSFDDERSGFLLHVHPVDVQIDGQYDAMNQLIRDLLDQRWLADFGTIRLTPIDDGQVRLQLQVRMYGLTVDDGSLDDDFALRTPTQRR